jgi:hypothetical protein
MIYCVLSAAPAAWRYHLPFPSHRAVYVCVCMCVCVCVCVCARAYALAMLCKQATC